MKRAARAAALPSPNSPSGITVAPQIWPSGPSNSPGSPDIEDLKRYRPAWPRRLILRETAGPLTEPGIASRYLRELSNE